MQKSGDYRNLQSKMEKKDCIHFNIYSGARLFLRAVVSAPGYCNRTSGSHGVESSGGTMFGMGIALVIVWIIFMVITLSAPEEDIPERNFSRI